MLHDLDKLCGNQELKKMGSKGIALEGCMLTTIEMLIEKRKRMQINQVRERKGKKKQE